MAIFCDTNILLYAVQPYLKQYSASKNVIQNQTFFISDQTCTEFVSVSSSSKLQIYSLKEAVNNINQLSKMKNISLLHPNEKTLSIWFDLQRKYSLRQKQVFDTYMVATMLSHKVNKLVTYNDKDFNMFKEIEVINPDSLG